MCKWSFGLISVCHFSLAYMYVAFPLLCPYAMEFLAWFFISGNSLVFEYVIFLLACLPIRNKLSQIMWFYDQKTLLKLSFKTVSWNCLQ